MKISNQLPQFNIGPALIIVADHHHCIFYEAYQGEIRRLCEAAAEKTEYSDREDFARRVGGIIFESGAGFEKRHRLVEASFERMFKRLYSQHFASTRYDAVYIFAPEPVSGFIRRLVAKKHGTIVSIHGTYMKVHQFELLRKLQAKMLPTALRTMYLRSFG